MLRILEPPQVVFQEVPGEICLAFQITGCNLFCKGCHSPHIWKEQGQILTEELLISYLDRYRGLLSGIVFLGGEWRPESLHRLLQVGLNSGLVTCLYTGRDIEELPPHLLEVLTYIKTGRWVQDLGGLDSPLTNQRFVEVSTGTLLNHKFTKRVV